MKFDLIYVKMTIELSKSSNSWRKKVGCLIVDYSNSIPRIISDGVNGTLPGHDNNCEDIEGATLDYVIHAEDNALRKLDKRYENMICYVTFQPCIECAKKLIQAGVKRVVYAWGYKNQDGVNLLIESGVEVVHKPISKRSIPPFDLDYTGWLRYKYQMNEKSINSFVALSRREGKFKREL